MRSSEPLTDPLTIEEAVELFRSSVAPDPMEDPGAAEDDPEWVADVARTIERNLDLPPVSGAIGCGQLGCAFGFRSPGARDKVLKLTSDPEEVQAATNLLGKRLRNVAKVFHSYRIGDFTIYNRFAHRELPIGLLVTERLDNVGLPSDHDGAALSEAVGRIKHRHSAWPHELAESSRQEARKRLRTASKELADYLDSGSDDLTQVADGLRELAAEGIYAVDVHQQNVGFNDYSAPGGREEIEVKIFDLGISSSPMRKKPKRIGGRREPDLFRRNAPQRNVLGVATDVCWPNVPICEARRKVAVLR